MATDIKCPSCGHKFPMAEAMSEEYKKDLKEQMLSWTKKKEEDYQRKFDEMVKVTQQQQLAFDKKFAEEKKRIQESLEVDIRKSIAGDFENQLKMLETSNRDNEEKLKLARQKELEFLKKEQELKNKEADLEIQLQRKLQEERVKLTDQIRKYEIEKNSHKESEFQLRLKELEKQLEDQKKLAEEMRRKAEQGSMQLQGEVQELLLESILKEHFPFDQIEEVGKGPKN